MLISFRHIRVRFVDSTKRVFAKPLSGKKTTSTEKKHKSPVLLNNISLAFVLFNFVLNGFEKCRRLGSIRLRGDNIYYANPECGGHPCSLMPFIIIVLCYSRSCNISCCWWGRRPPFIPLINNSYLSHFQRYLGGFFFLPSFPAIFSESISHSFLFLTFLNRSFLCLTFFLSFLNLMPRAYYLFYLPLSQSFIYPFHFSTSEKGNYTRVENILTEK